MKKKLVIASMGLMIAPLLMAAKEGVSYETTDQFEIQFFDMGAVGNSNQKFKVKIENTSAGYISPEPYIYDNVYSFEIVNEPFYQPSALIAPNEECEFTVVVPRTATINTYYKSALYFANEDSNAIFTGNYSLSYGNQTNYDCETIYVDCIGENLNYDFAYEYFINITYQGRQYNLMCSLDEYNKPYFEVNKNTEIDDIRVNYIKAFQLEQIHYREGRSWNFGKLFVFIFVAPILLAMVISAIVAIIIVGVLKRNKRYTSHYNNNSRY